MQLEETSTPTKLLLHFLTGVRCMLKSTYNLGNPRNGMEKLLISCMATPPSLFSRIHSTDAVAITSVLNKTRAIADVLSTLKLPLLPTITTCADAQDKAVHINYVIKPSLVLKRVPLRPSLTKPAPTSPMQSPELPTAPTTGASTTTSFTNSSLQSSRALSVPT